MQTSTKFALAASAYSAFTWVYAGNDGFGIFHFASLLALGVAMIAAIDSAINFIRESE